MADPPDWGFDRLSPATRWILAHGLPTSLESPDEPLDEESWNRLRRECSAHRLHGHLIDAVGSDDLPVTDAQRREAARLELELTSARSTYDDICRPVLDALDDAHIPLRLLKGSALPWSDYPDPQLRPTGDLDLLVPGAHLAAATELLESLGGRLVNPEPAAGFARKVFKGLTVEMPSGLEVDLHRILSWGPFGVRVPELDLWSPGRSVDVLGHPYTTLDAERTLIHLCAHLLILGAVRASEVRDVAQLATSPGIRPERTIEIARRWGHETLLAVGILMAVRELALDPETVPLARWAAGHRISVRDRIWLRVDRPDAPVPGMEPLGVFIELDDWQARAIYARAIVTPRSGTDPSALARVRSIATRLRRKSDR